MATAAIVGAGVIGAAGSVFAAREARKGAEAIADAAQQPIQAFDQSLISDLLTGQNSILLGASPDQVAEDFILSRANRNVGPQAARSIASALDSIKANLLAGRTGQAQSALNRLNQQFQGAGLGIPVSASITDNQLVFEFADEGVNRFLNEARLLGPQIRQQRLSGISQFNQLLDPSFSATAGPQFATPESFERFRGLTEQGLLSELRDREQQAREQTLQTANVGGLNPAAGLSRITERGLLSREDIENQSIQRAIGLISAQQGIVGQQQGIRAREASILEGLLFPQSSFNLANLENQQAATTNQLAAAQLSASTQAGLTAVGAGASGTFGAFQQSADAITLAALLSRAGGGPASQPQTIEPALPNPIVGSR